MIQQHLFLGTVANDGTGDTIRAGGQKIEDNFDELYPAVALNTAKQTNATHTGEVTGSGVLTITDKAVTLAKMNDMATASLIYRRAAGTGTPEVNTLVQLLADMGLIGGARTTNQTFNIAAGIISTVITALTTKPYSVQFWDSSGNQLNASISIEETTIGGFYAYNLYSVDAMNNVEIRLVY
jgi:hypothetical protein